MVPPSRALSAADIRRVQTSFRLAEQQAVATAQRFYHHLFRLDPALRRLFHGGMVEQGRKLIDMLALVSSRLDRLDELLPTVRELGVRHVGYHVQESHYMIARAALLAALQDILGAGFTSATRQAWARAYDLLAETMIAAARAAAAPAPANTRRSRGSRTNVPQ